jgi:perosamine synthetase
VFVDIDPVTWNIDPAKIEERITPKTRCIIAVHTFGYPAEMAPILAMARKHGLAVIEDVCEALGVRVTGDLGVFAFYPNKQITTGEGGVVVTGRPELAETIRALRNHGRGPNGIQLLGYNYRLSEIASALGVSQMKRLPAILSRRASVAAMYAQELKTIPEVTAPAERASWFVYTVGVDARDAVWQAMTARSIECGRYFPPLHRQPLFRSFATTDLPNTDHVASRTLQLPFFNNLSREQVVEVCTALREACQRART